MVVLYWNVKLYMIPSLPFCRPKLLAFDCFVCVMVVMVQKGVVASFCFIHSRRRRRRRRRSKSIFHTCAPSIDRIDERQDSSFYTWRRAPKLRLTTTTLVVVSKSLINVNGEKHVVGMVVARLWVILSLSVGAQFNFQLNWIEKREVK